MESPSHLSIFETPEALAIGAAERFVSLTKARNTEQLSIALAGGTTPKRVYELLASGQFEDRIDWSRVHLFFGDERCVPPTHSDSNYRMAHDALISKVPIPPRNVHRIKAELPPAQAAEAYEQELKQFFPNVTWPRFDLVFLGMGADGHAASLFPDSEALRENSKWVVATKEPRSGQDRITLTLPVLNNAAGVLFLVTGQNKAQRLREVLRSDQDTKSLPAGLIRPAKGTIEWLVDAAAASLPEQV